MPTRDKLLARLRHGIKMDRFERIGVSKVLRRVYHRIAFSHFRPRYAFVSNRLSEIHIYIYIRSFCAIDLRLFIWTSAERIGSSKQTARSSKSSFFEKTVNVFDYSEIIESPRFNSSQRGRERERVATALLSSSLTLRETISLEILKSWFLPFRGEGGRISRSIIIIIIGHLVAQPFAPRKSQRAPTFPRIKVSFGFIISAEISWIF